jgi:cell division protein FtsA
MNARIGLPNEHLTSGHAEELAKPMYATCIGMILKGYHEYERSMLKENPQFIKINQPKSEEAQQVAGATTAVSESEFVSINEATLSPKKRKTIRTWMDGFKTGLIDLFKEEDEKELK